MQLGRKATTPIIKQPQPFYNRPKKVNQSQDWDTLVYKQVELQKRLESIKRQQDLERRNKYKQALDQQIQQINFNKISTKSLQRKLDNQKLKQSQFSSDKIKEDMRFANKQKTRAIRKLMDQNLKQRQKQQINQVNYINSLFNQQERRESAKNFYNKQYEEQEYRDKLVKEAAHKNRIKVQKDLRQNYQEVKRQKNEAKQKELQFDKQIQKIYSQKLISDEQNNQNQFQSKQKRFAAAQSPVQMYNDVKKLQKAKLIDQFSINGRLQNQRRFLQEENTKKENKRRAILQQNNALKSQISDKTKEQERKKQQSAEFVKVIEEKMSLLKLRQDIQKTNQRQKNQELRRELDKQIKQNAQRKISQKQMSQIEKKLQRGAKIQLLGLENPLESNKRQQQYLDKYLGIDPNRPRRLQKLKVQEPKQVLQGSKSIERFDNKFPLNLQSNNNQQVRTLQVNTSLPQISLQRSGSVQKFQNPENVYGIKQSNRFSGVQEMNSPKSKPSISPMSNAFANSSSNFGKLNNPPLNVHNSVQLGVGNEQKKSRIYSPRLNRNETDTLDIAIKNQDIALRRGQIPNIKASGNHTPFNLLPSITKADINSSVEMIPKNDRDSNNLSSGIFQNQRKSVPIGYANYALELQRRHERKSSVGKGNNSSYKMYSVLNHSNQQQQQQVENPYSSSQLQSINNWEDKLRGQKHTLSHDPVSGLSKRSYPNKQGFQDVVSRNQSQKHSTRQDIGKYWNLSSELDKKIRDNMKTTSIRNDFGQSNNFEPVQRNFSSLDYLSKRGYNIIS